MSLEKDDYKALVEESKTLKESLQRQLDQNGKLDERLTRIQLSSSDEITYLKEMISSTKDANNELRLNIQSLMQERKKEAKKVKTESQKNQQDLKFSQTCIAFNEDELRKLDENILDENEKLDQAKAVNASLQDEFERLETMLGAMSKCAREDEELYLIMKKDLLLLNLESTKHRLIQEVIKMRELLLYTSEASIPNTETLSKGIQEWDSTIASIHANMETVKKETDRLLKLISKGRPLNALFEDICISDVPYLNASKFLNIIKADMDENILEVEEQAVSTQDACLNAEESDLNNNYRGGNMETCFEKVEENITIPSPLIDGKQYVPALCSCKLGLPQLLCTCSSNIKEKIPVSDSQDPIREQNRFSPVLNKMHENNDKRFLPLFDPSDHKMPAMLPLNANKVDRFMPIFDPSDHKMPADAEKKISPVNANNVKRFLPIFDPSDHKMPADAEKNFLPVNANNVKRFLPIFDPSDHKMPADAEKRFSPVNANNDKRSLPIFDPSDHKMPADAEKSFSPVDANNLKRSLPNFDPSDHKMPADAEKRFSPVDANNVKRSLPNFDPSDHKMPADAEKSFSPVDANNLKRSMPNFDPSDHKMPADAEKSFSPVDANNLKRSLSNFDPSDHKIPADTEKRFSPVDTNNDKRSLSNFDPSDHKMPADTEKRFSPVDTNNDKRSLSNFDPSDHKMLADTEKRFSPVDTNNDKRSLSNFDPSDHKMPADTEKRFSPVDTNNDKRSLSSFDSSDHKMPADAEKRFSPVNASSDYPTPVDDWRNNGHFLHTRLSDTPENTSQGPSEMINEIHTIGGGLEQHFQPMSQEDKANVGNDEAYSYLEELMNWGKGILVPRNVPSPNVNTEDISNMREICVEKKGPSPSSVAFSSSTRI